MRIGVSTWWFNRGQGTVGRHLRSALDTLGHETYVLARPSPPRFVRPQYVDSGGVWAQPRITVGSSHKLRGHELVEWATLHGLDAVFFFQKYDFEAVQMLRESGVKTLGCFMWEAFARPDVEPANRAYDLVYSLNRCSHERYLAWGLNSFLLGWGCHPELHRHPWNPTADDRVTFLFPGGYLSERKPVRAVLQAFLRADIADARLLIKAQVRKPALPGEADPRVEVCSDDLDLDEYLRLLSSSHALIGPSRWEGLGYHLYEALGCGIPTIVNDAPPLNEVLDGAARMVRAVDANFKTRAGIRTYEPDVRELAEAIEEMTDPQFRAASAAAMRARATDYSWESFLERLESLLTRVGLRPATPLA